MMRLLSVFLIVFTSHKSPLTLILNLSLLEGVFQIELKVGNVLPLYKTDDMLFNNYRPVSLLSVLSKVFQQMVYLISLYQNNTFVRKLIWIPKATFNIQGSYGITR